MGWKGVTIMDQRVRFAPSRLRRACATRTPLNSAVPPKNSYSSPLYYAKIQSDQENRGRVVSINLFFQK